MPISMPHWPKPLGNRPIHFIDLGLSRVLELSERLGNPHKKIPNIIHVAGTNGKASTIAFLRQILEESGYTVNVYTSPHLIYFNERLILNGKEITDKQLYDTLEDCRVVSEGIPVTFFEGVTVGAFLALSRTKADFTIIETGLGGRLDATNIIDPIISIITSISLDHTEYLGDTVEKIAQEKAGIIKKGAVSIISPQTPSVLHVLENYARQVGSNVYRAEREWSCSKAPNGICFTSNDESVIYPNPSLIGDHQIINAGNSIACATLLHNKFGYTKITYESIASGMVNAYCPARLELIKKEHYFTNLCDIFIDGAHNIGGAEVLANWCGSRKLCMIIGMTREKDTVSFLKQLKSNIAILCSVCVQGEPRSQTAAEIQKSASIVGLECITQENISEALNYIIGCTNPTEQNKTTVLICGSLFLAKDLFNLFNAP